MKVVLLHDWLTGFRGGERVLEVFCELFPEAPIYTLLHNKNSTSDLIESREIKTSFLNQMPFVKTKYRHYLPLFPMAAEGIKISEKLEPGDLVLSSSHCVIKGVQKPEGVKHICYIHSPMRYLYDQYDVYFGPDSPLVNRWGMKFFKSYLTEWDLRSNQNVDHFVANSQFVAQRVRRLYQRESDVIHPFVDLKDFHDINESKKDFYVMVTAFAPNKRVDIAIQTFNHLKKPLKIIGAGQQEDYLKSIAGPNIEFLGSVDRQQVVKNLAQAKALVFPGVEDFGITPLEALAAGTPVIAFDQGGVLETLDHTTAQFFSEPTSQSLTEAIVQFEKKEFEQDVLKERAGQFSKEKFKSEIRHLIKQKMSDPF